MTYGDCEQFGVYCDDNEHGSVLLGEIMNRMEYVSGLAVHAQKWWVWIGRARVECDSLGAALDTSWKMAKRLGVDGPVSWSAMDRERKYLPGTLRMQFKSDYEVGQRLKLDIPVVHHWSKNSTECIEAECEVLESESIGSRGWWMRMGYESGEFAAIEAMDGQLSVQLPVGDEAWGCEESQLLIDTSECFYIVKRGGRG